MSIAQIDYYARYQRLSEISAVVAWIVGLAVLLICILLQFYAVAVMVTEDESSLLSFLSLAVGVVGGIAALFMLFGGEEAYYVHIALAVTALILWALVGIYFLVEGSRHKGEENIVRVLQSGTVVRRTEVQPTRGLLLVKSVPLKTQRTLTVTAKPKLKKVDSTPGTEVTTYTFELKLDEEAALTMYLQQKRVSLELYKKLNVPWVDVEKVLQAIVDRGLPGDVHVGQDVAVNTAWIKQVRLLGKTLSNKIALK